MRVSVVICTYNRLASLRDTLDALRRQTHGDFEVVVVDGPSTDGTSEYLRSLGDAVRTVSNPQRHLSKSRNLGIAAAAGELVAFIDDDAVPEPRWLEDLAAAFDGPDVAAAGGIVLDETGVRVQWHHMVCARTGEQDFDRRPPLDAFCGPGADPFLYVPGGNSAFRRASLAEIGGFDEEVEYNYDETEVCLRLHDAGRAVRVVDGAVVHHGFRPSHLRSAVWFTDPFFEVKNRVYFALRHGTATRPAGVVLASLNLHLSRLKAAARDRASRGLLDAGQLAHYLGRADAGFHVGLQRGLRGARRGVAIGPPDPEAFRPYPILAPSRRRRLAVIGVPAGDEAVAGHEVHVIVAAPAGEPYRVGYEGGTWVRRVPVNERWIPEVADADERARLAELAALHGGVAALGDVEVVDPDGRLAEPPEDLRARLLDPRRFPVDWEAEARLCLAEGEPEGFVEAAYGRLLGREPDPLGRRTMLADLRAGVPPSELVRRLAGSVEGRGRGLDPELALPAVDLPVAAAALRLAWVRDDAGFARDVVELLLGDGDADVGPVLERLREGTSRTALVRELAARPEALERVAGAASLPPADVRTRDELRAALRAAVRVADDAGFMDAASRVLLGRPVDEVDGARHWAALRSGTPRSVILRDIAASPAGARHGMDPELVKALVPRNAAYQLHRLRGRLRGLRSL